MHFTVTTQWFLTYYTACVAAVKSRPVLHHCVVILFWSSGIMECMIYTFQNRVPLMRQGASVVWHISLPLMNSFNKTEAAVFTFRLCFLRLFPFILVVQFKDALPVSFDQNCLHLNLNHTLVHPTPVNMRNCQIQLSKYKYYRKITA